MRAYFFGNSYLSSLQQGLQAAHVVSEMFTKYGHNNLLHNWAKDYKTIILLNGGNAKELRELFLTFSHEENVYPWASFQEDEESLNRAWTSVGIILPERIYETAKFIRTAGPGKWEQHSGGFLYRTHQTQNEWISFSEWQDFSFFETKLCELLNKYRLAI